MKLYIDGDSCHVLKLAEGVARRFGIECHIYCDPNHMIESKYSELHYVEKGFNSADFAIINKVCEGDIVVTNDSGLASMVLSRKGTPINSKGFVFNDYNISTFLNSRHLRTYTRKKTGRNKVKGMLSDEYSKNSNEKPNFYNNLVGVVQKRLRLEEKGNQND